MAKLGHRKLNHWNFWVMISQNIKFDEWVLSNSKNTDKKVNTLARLSHYIWLYKKRKSYESLSLNLNIASSARLKPIKNISLKSRMNQLRKRASWFLYREIISRCHPQRHLLSGCTKLQNLKYVTVLSVLSLHKKWSFSLRISSLKVTNSAVCGNGHIYWRNP